MSERIHLTEPYVKALKPRDRRYAIFCGEVPGFGVRVHRSGRKTYIVQAIPLGAARQVVVKLGNVNAMRFPSARQAAVDVLEDLRKGRNPTADKKAARDQTLRALAESYLAVKKCSADFVRYLRAGWLGQVPTRTYVVTEQRRFWQTTWSDGPHKMLRDRPAAFITRAEIVARLDDVRAEKGSWSARHHLDAIRRVLNWAARGHRFGVTISVAAGLVDADVGLTTEDKQRTRILAPAELRAVWAACGSDPFGILVKVLLLTGQRRDDWREARWTEVSGVGTADAAGPLLAVPRERYKARRPHAVPITPVVAGLLAELPRWDGCPWVFSLNGRTPISGLSKMKKRLDAASGVKGWTLHDLRRTCRTMLREIGVSRDTAEVVIGHALTGLDSVYDQGSHIPEKRLALEKYETALMKIVEQRLPQNVVRLRAG